MMGVTEDDVERWAAMGAPVKTWEGTRPAGFDSTKLTEWLLRSAQEPPVHQDDVEPLPPSAQEIADVIGRERTLTLIGKLPPSGSRPWRVCLYVPRRIGPDHPLVGLIGWRDANLLVREFGGMILQPSNCRLLSRQWRRRGIIMLHQQGLTAKQIAEQVEMSARQVANIIAAGAGRGDRAQQG